MVLKLFLDHKENFSLNQDPRCKNLKWIHKTNSSPTNTNNNILNRLKIWIFLKIKSISQAKLHRNASINKLSIKMITIIQ